MDSNSNEDDYSDEQQDFFDNPNLRRASREGNSGAAFYTKFAGKGRQTMTQQSEEERKSFAILAMQKHQSTPQNLSQSLPISGTKVSVLTPQEGGDDMFDLIQRNVIPEDKSSFRRRKTLIQPFNVIEEREEDDKEETKHDQVKTQKLYRQSDTKQITTKFNEIQRVIEAENVESEHNSSEDMESHFDSMLNMSREQMHSIRQEQREKNLVVKRDDGSDQRCSSQQVFSLSEIMDEGTNQDKRQNRGTLLQPPGLSHLKSSPASSKGSARLQKIDEEDTQSKNSNQKKRPRDKIKEKFQNLKKDCDPQSKMKDSFNQTGNKISKFFNENLNPFAIQQALQLEKEQKLKEAQKAQQAKEVDKVQIIDRQEDFMISGETNKEVDQTKDMIKDYFETNNQPSVDEQTKDNSQSKTNEKGQESETAQTPLKRLALITKSKFNFKIRTPSESSGDMTDEEFFAHTRDNTVIQTTKDKQKNKEDFFKDFQRQMSLVPADQISDEVKSQDSLSDKEKDNCEMLDHINKLKQTTQLDQSMAQDPILDITMDKKQEKKSKSISKIDSIKLIDQNEKLFIKNAESILERNERISLKNIEVGSFKQEVTTDPENLKDISKDNLIHQRTYKYNPTCIAHSDILIHIGNSGGQVWSYDRETGETFEMFQEKSKDFQNNAVTCLDVHHKRQEYILCGHQKGQILLLDLLAEPKKRTVKIIKDSHQGKPIASVKFLDWAKEREPLPDNKKGERRMWLYASLDNSGQVLVTSIKKALIGYDTTKMVLIQSIYDVRDISVPTNLTQTICAKFSNRMYPQDDVNDDCTLIAVGGNQRTSIYWADVNSKRKLFQLNRPYTYSQKETNKILDFPNRAPVLCWGFARTPVFKDKVYSVLAIAWGPLVQIAVLVDASMPENDFFEDGFYILQPNHQNEEEPIIESMHFINESILLVVTQNRESRTLYTHNFTYGKFQSPKNPIDEKPEEKQQQIKDAVDLSDDEDENQFFTLQKQEYVHRESLVRFNSYKEQCRVSSEIKVGTIVEPPVARSCHGQATCQTMLCYEDTVVWLGDDATVNRIRHIDWLESLKLFKKHVQGDWMKVFARAIDIYNGKVKGFKGLTDEDNYRKHTMKADLKILIKDLIQEVIKRWNNTKKQSDSIMNQAFKESFGESQEDNYKTLIHIVVEFCVEIQDTSFLFTELYILFEDVNLGLLMVQELIPFILAGRFHEVEQYEYILGAHILNSQKKVYLQNPMQRPAENFEKIILSLNLDLCKQDFLNDLISFCEENKMTTAVTHLTLKYTPQHDSCCKALEKLRQSYLNAEYQGSIRSVQSLLDLPVNSDEKIPIERTKTYLGYKLFWAIRLLLYGKLFPHIRLKDAVWRSYVHDIADLITEDKFMKTLVEIDASVYFQILSVLFYPGRQLDFLKDGRSEKEDKIPMDHNIIMSRLTRAFQTEESDRKEDQRMQYLFFVTSVASKSDIRQDPQFYYKVVVDIVKELPKFVEFNRSLMERSMTQKRLMRQLSKHIGEDRKIKDENKYIYLSEKNLLILLELSEPLSSEQIETILQEVQFSSFDKAKIFLNEKKEDYLMCLKLLLNKTRIDETKKSLKTEVFDWIHDKLNLLKSRVANKSDLRRETIVQQKNAQNKWKYEQFNREVLVNLNCLVNLNANYTLELVDLDYEGDHLKILESSLDKYPKEQFTYLSAILESKLVLPQAEMNKKDLVNRNRYFRMYMKLLCDLEPDNVITTLEKLVENHKNDFPSFDCLKICEAANQIEACAYLNLKVGDYNQSVVLYFHCLREKLDLKILKKELYNLKKLYKQIDPKRVGSIIPQVTHFGRIIRKVLKIFSKHADKVLCRSNSSQIWQEVLYTLYSIRNNSKIVNHDYCTEYIDSHIVSFLRVIFKQVHFNVLFDFLLVMQEDKNSFKLQDIQDLVEETFEGHNTELEMLCSAKKCLNTEISCLQESFMESQSNGLLYRYITCELCHYKVSDADVDIRKCMDLAVKDLNQDEEFYFNRNFDHELFSHDSELIGYVFQCPMNHQFAQKVKGRPLKKKQLVDIKHWNHSYHYGCILKFIWRQIIRDKIIDARQYVTTEQVEDHFRCPICFKKCLNIASQGLEANLHKIADDLDEDQDYVPNRKKIRPSQNHARRMTNVGQQPLSLTKQMSNPFGEDHVTSLEELTNKQHNLMRMFDQTSWYESITLSNFR